MRGVSNKLDHKKRFDRKNITLHVYHVFWYISLRSSVAQASGVRCESLAVWAVLSSQICEDRVLSFLNTKQLTFIKYLFCVLAIFLVSCWAINLSQPRPHRLLVFHMAASAIPRLVKLVFEARSSCE